MQAYCHNCGTSLSPEGHVARWQGLEVDRHTMSVRWYGEALDLYRRHCVRIRYLFMLVRAKGGIVPTTAFDDGYTVGSRRVFITEVRNWLLEHKLPFDIPRAMNHSGYWLEFTG